MYREKEKSVPPVPHNLQEYAQTLQHEEWESFGKTKGNPPEPFFHTLIEDATDDWTAVLFISPKMLEVLGTTNSVHIDATFQVVPAELHAYQLMTVHVLFMNHVSKVITISVEVYYVDHENGCVVRFEKTIL